MKKVSLFLLVTMILAFSSPVFASPAPDWTADSVCTRVASIAYYTQSISTGTNGKIIEGAMVKTHIFGYESNGYRIQYITYSPDGKQAQIYVYNYDDVAPDVLQLASIVEYDGPTKKITARENMSYDNTKNTTTAVKTDVSDNLITTSIYYTNAQNLDYLVEVYDASGKMINKTELEYSSTGQMISQIYTDFITGLVTTTKREFNATGTRIEKEVITNENEVIVSTFQYDDYDDNWTIKSSYRSTNGTTESKSLLLFEKVYRLITPYG